MRKQVFILNCENGNAGVVKNYIYEEKSVIQLQLSNKISGIKKVYVYSEKNQTELCTLKKSRAEIKLPPSYCVDKIVIKDENGKLLCWSGEMPKEVDEPPLNPQNEFNFENFFGGGFEWKKIRGRFIVFDYSIIHYILSDEKVYRSINRSGFYIAGIKNVDQMKIIAVSIPLVKRIETPFSEINADTYAIKTDKIIYDTICVGIDNTGEFFLSL